MQGQPLSGLRSTELSAKWPEIEVITNSPFKEDIQTLNLAWMHHFLIVLFLGYVDDANGLLKDINTEDLMRVCE